MLDSPPPYTPLPSIWTRVFNWVLPPLGVAVEDLRPEAKYVQITFAAVYDIRFCENVFDHWTTQLDKVMSGSKKPDERERLLRFYLGLLREDAGWCSNATNKILQCHVRFASLMAQRIDDAPKSRYKLKTDETTRLANDIRVASCSLSIHVTKMKDNLASLVSALEKVQVTVKKERSLAERILGWLKSLFKAIARIFATFCVPISGLLHSAEPEVLKSVLAVSTLRKAAATICAAEVGPQEGKESESLDSVILFLKEIVPREAEIALEKLKRFDEALEIMGLESRMRAGRRVTLYGLDPAAVAQEWRGLAKKYQSVLPDDEDLGF